MTDIPVIPALPPFLTSWIPGKTPVSTWPAASAVILSYLATVFVLQEIMKDRSALRLRTPFRIHNALLSIASLVLLALMVEEGLEAMVQRRCVQRILCEGVMDKSERLFKPEMTFPNSSFFQRLEFYYMINYYFKYFEFLDTVFLVLKKRPLCTYASRDSDDQMLISVS
ncbi:GNS1/SUR4 family-domain-containing protein [Chiua virens]|nr:GNS1/SUR4 family-domain-containing protein [Chiua virens]